jgi:hypothetical protein
MSDEMVNELRRLCEDLSVRYAAPIRLGDDLDARLKQDIEARGYQVDEIVWDGNTANVRLAPKADEIIIDLKMVPISKRDRDADEEGKL